MTLVAWPVGSSIYLGAPGALAQITGSGNSGSLSVTGGPSVVLARTVDGGQRAQWVKGPRQWKVQLAHCTAAMAATVDGFTGGYAGVGPWSLVTPDAQVSNVLTPDDSMLRGLSVPSSWSSGGPKQIDGGPWVASGWLNGAGSTGAQSLWATPAPVLEANPVTVSLWVWPIAGATATLTVVVRNVANGALLTGTSSATTGPTRLVVSIPSCPAGTATVTATIAGASVVYAPAVTWTPGPLDWAPGRGCAAVTVQGIDADLLLATPTDAWLSRSLVIDEVSA